MRDAINNNPIAQVGVVVVLIIAAFLMFTRMTKKDEPAPAPTLGDPGTQVVGGTGAGAVPPGTAAPATGDPAAAGAVVDPALAATDPAAAAAAAAGTVPVGVPVVPAPPLPPAVDAAYRDGKVVALLVTRGGGFEDKFVRKSLSSLRSDGDAAVFAVRAEKVARFAAITQGVNLDRVPALVVVRPGGGKASVASAQVEYGFRDAESLEQAVRDALYRGPAVGYSPD